MQQPFKKPYLLAFIPESKGPGIIQLTEKLAYLANDYLLGQHSLPHLTLYRFTAEQHELAAIWQAVQLIWDKPFIEIEFKNYSCITFDGILWWPSLLPSNDKELVQLHKQIANTINKPIDTLFDPHMTLINTKHSACHDELLNVMSSYIPISDKFTLALGESDAIGQLVKLIT